MDAWKELAYAEHLVRVTLPVVRDKHVFINVLNHLDNAFSDGLSRFLKIKKINKEIPIYPTTKELQVEILMDKYKKVIPNIALFKEFLEVIKAHRENYNEMVKEDFFIIMRSDYKILRLEREDLIKYIELIKQILKNMGV